LPLPETCRPWL